MWKVYTKEQYLIIGENGWMLAKPWKHFPMWKKPIMKGHPLNISIWTGRPQKASLHRSGSAAGVRMKRGRKTERKAKGIQEGGRSLNPSLLFQRTWVWFPACILSCSQPPVTPVPGRTYISGLTGHMLGTFIHVYMPTHRFTHVHIIKTTVK